MTKLNDKDRQFIKESTIHMEGGSYVFLDDVEELVLQKQTEIDELKAYVNNLNHAMESILDEGRLFDFEDMNNILEINPKQSLAEHDNQVRIEALESFSVFLTSDHFLDKTRHDEINEFINQLKDKYHAHKRF